MSKSNYNYILGKLSSFAFSLFAVITIAFFMTRAMPGDPFAGEDSAPYEVFGPLNALFGLDKPVYIQYFNYMKGLLQGDLGPSFYYFGKGVGEIIARGAPVSLCLGALSLIMGIPLGFLLGIVAAYLQGSWIDKVITRGSIFILSIPVFVFSIWVQCNFSINISATHRWFPYAFFMADSFLQGLLLPAMTIAVLNAARLARLVRSSAIEILGQDYILTARAKGLSPWQIARCHLFRNSLVPLLGELGPMCAYNLTGSFLIEKTYSIPGLGRWFVHSISQRDYTMIMGLTVYFSFVLLLSMFLIDLLISWADPRVAIAKKQEYL